MPHAVQVIGGGTIGWLPYSTFVVIGLSLAALALMTTLVWGRWLYAVGGNPDSARRIGVPVKTGADLGLRPERARRPASGRLITAGMTNTGSPTFGQLSELDSIAAVIIGGAAFARRPRQRRNALVGAFTIGVIRNALNLSCGQRLLPADRDRGRDRSRGRGRRDPRPRWRDACGWRRRRGSA